MDEKKTKKSVKSKNDGRKSQNKQSKTAKTTSVPADVRSGKWYDIEDVFTTYSRIHIRESASDTAPVVAIARTDERVPVSAIMRDKRGYAWAKVRDGFMGIGRTESGKMIVKYGEFDSPEKEREIYAD